MRNIESQVPNPHIRQAIEPEQLSAHEKSHINLTLGSLAATGELPENRTYDRLIEEAVRSHHDQLMPEMLNRTGLDLWFERYRPETVGVILSDAIDFDKANKFGQNVGDDVLRFIGRNFMSRLRTKDKSVPDDRRKSHVHDVVAVIADGPDTAGARYGGDEFMGIVNLDQVPPKKRGRIMREITGRLHDFGNFTDEGKGIILPVHIRSVYEISSNPSDSISSIYASLSPELVTMKQSER